MMQALLCIPFSEKQLDADEYLFHRGDKTDAIYRIKTGRLRLLRHTEAGRVIALHTARSGDLFAEAALFSESYHCDAVADVNSQIEVYCK